jgi:hypothetical protein
MAGNERWIEASNSDAGPSYLPSKLQKLFVEGMLESRLPISVGAMG